MNYWCVLQRDWELKRRRRTEQVDSFRFLVKVQGSGFSVPGLGFEPRSTDKTQTKKLETRNPELGTLNPEP